jgi:CheY-like chemotaxis protein
VPSPGRDIEGIGLGLAILRRMADLIGTRIAFSSTPGKGTAIGIRGLVRTTAPTVPAPVAPAHPKSLLYGARVVLIEDDPAVLLSTQLLMERWGCVVQALGAPSRDTGPCDIIVADYDLNGPLSGTDAIGEIRTRQGWLVPAIIVTAHDEDRIRSEMHGAVLPILPKPTRPAELRSVMLGMLAGGERPAPRA